MSELKDPKIKIFGKTIGLPETFPEEKVGESCDGAGEECSIVDPPAPSDSILEGSNWDGDAEDEELNKNQSCLNKDKDEDRAQPLASEKLKDSTTTPLSAYSDAGPIQSLEREKYYSETGNSQEKTLKKPDKIIPCPRCNSMDTKFCYFNNYNVNQPRHFCRKCQRYWKAGGTMRNVPVGAGRRKNKNAASQFRHPSVLEGLQNARADIPNGTHHPMVSPNGSVVTFSSDTPLCESMVSVLNIADKTAGDGFHKPQEVGRLVSNGRKENGDDHSSGSSCTAESCSNDEVGKTMLPEQIPNFHPFPRLEPCFPRAPWPYPWHSVQWTAPVSLPPASFAMPSYSPAPPYWGCAVPGPWNVPWVIPPTPSQSRTPPNSGPNSQTLGKHSRDDKTLKPLDPEEVSENESRDPGKCLWVPKTLRIADPGEAAKSSIWATLGIMNERAGSVGSGGVLKAFEGHSKGGEKTLAPQTNTALQANPAAL